MNWGKVMEVGTKVALGLGAAAVGGPLGAVVLGGLGVHEATKKIAELEGSLPEWFLRDQPFELVRAGVPWTVPGGFAFSAAEKLVVDLFDDLGRDLKFTREQRALLGENLQAALGSGKLSEQECLTKLDQFDAYAANWQKQRLEHRDSQVSEAVRLEASEWGKTVGEPKMGPLAYCLLRGKARAEGITLKQAHKKYWGAA